MENMRVAVRDEKRKKTVLNMGREEGRGKSQKIIQETIEVSQTV